MHWAGFPRVCSKALLFLFVFRERFLLPPVPIVLDGRPPKSLVHQTWKQNPSGCNMSNVWEICAGPFRTHSLRRRPRRLPALQS